MNIDLATLKRFESYIKTHIPGFEVRFKNESWSQKLLGTLLFFNPNYITGFITTFYPYVYFPTKEGYEANPTNSFIILAHEFVHLYDDKNNLSFKISYLFPQILSVLFILSGLISLFFSWIPFVILLTIGVLCLLPLPAPYRVHWEKRGYAMSMFVINHITQGDYEIKNFLKETFLGWSYFKMSWSENDIDKWYNNIKSNPSVLLSDSGCEVYAMVNAFIESEQSL